MGKEDLFRRDITVQINIGFGINNDFCQHCACTMASILANSDKNDNYTFYIVYDALSHSNRSKLKELKKIRPFNINFIKISASEYQKLAENTKVDSSSFFRLKLFSLDNIDKVLYLDSDIIVRKNIASVYDTIMGDCYIAGIKDILCETLKKKYGLSERSIYVNAGVLLINLNLTRTVDMYKNFSKFSKLFKDFRYSDQDVINYSFQEKIAEIDLRYNYCFPYRAEYDHDYYYSIADDPSVVHYISEGKPWMPGSTCYMKSEYFKYLKMTPYYDDFIDKYRIEEDVAIMQKLNEIDEKINRILGPKN